MEIYAHQLNSSGETTHLGTCITNNPAPTSCFSFQSLSLIVSTNASSHYHFKHHEFFLWVFEFQKILSPHSWICFLQLTHSVEIPMSEKIMLFSRKISLQARSLCHLRNEEMYIGHNYRKPPTFSIVSSSSPLPVITYYDACGALSGGGWG